MSVTCIEGAQSNLFPNFVPKSPQKKKYQWEIEISGQQISIEASTKKEAFAEAISAVMPTHGWGIDTCYRKALEMGAQVTSKVPLN
jgi:hypothetical protein